MMCTVIGTLGILLCSLILIQATLSDPIRVSTSIHGSIVSCLTGSSSSYTKEAMKSNLDEIVNRFFPTAGCGSDGWTRAIYLNMSDPNQSCPNNWTLLRSPGQGCGRKSSGFKTCDSVYFPVRQLNYSSICGRIVAHQIGTSPALIYSVSVNPNITIEEAYVSGISLTHGPVQSRRHIWTFVGATGQTLYSDAAYYYCPCTNSSFSWPYSIPSYVGNHYFCDSGNPEFAPVIEFYGDPLWNGKGCISSNSCCQFNQPPWFYRHFSYFTSDDLELRLCGYNTQAAEDKSITLIEIYVK